MEQGEEESVEVEFCEEEEIPEIYANGAWGGRTPQGDLCINFIKDRSELPSSLTMNAAGETISQEGGKKFLREVQGRVFLNADTAFSIASWMIEKLIPGATEEEIKDLIAEEYNLTRRVEELKEDTE